MTLTGTIKSIQPSPQHKTVLAGGQSDKTGFVDILVELRGHVQAPGQLERQVDGLLSLELPRAAIRDYCLGDIFTVTVERHKSKP